MFRKLIVSALAFGIASVASVGSAAQCGPRDVIIDRLEARYLETLSGRGLQTSGNKATVVEVWASDDTGSFTVLVSNAHGLTCIVAAGTHWVPAAKLNFTDEPKGTPG